MSASEPRRTTVIEVQFRTSLPLWFWAMHVVVIGVSVAALIASALGLVR